MVSRASLCMLNCFSHVQLLATLWNIAHQASLLIGFSRQEYCSGLPIHSPGDLPDTRIELRSPALQADFLPFEPAFSSITQSCLNFCNYMDCSVPGFPVHHQFPGFIQTHAHWVLDAIQQSQPVLPPSPLAFKLSHHQGFFQWKKHSRAFQLFTPGGQSIGVSASASVLPMNTQDWSPSGRTGWIS